MISFPSLYMLYNRIYYKIIGLRGAYRLHKFLKERAVESLETYDGESSSFFGSHVEWDNLIILDACRADYYREFSPEAGKAVSMASCSRGFIEKEFSEGDFSDTVYITTNPHFSEKKFKEITGREIGNVFHEVFHTYKTDWNDNEGTVMPEPVIRDANTAEKLYPAKKKVIHFMQPHRPFVTSDIEMEGMSKDLDVGNQGIYSMARRREASKQEVRELYQENLEYVLSDLDGLELSGKSVITADHGEMLGENGIYAHPCGHNLKHLREVPWHVLPNSNFKEVFGSIPR